MKFTPAPWFIAYTHEDQTSIAIDDEPGMQGERDYDLITVTHGDPEELLANAKLIAKAPELFACLEALVKWGSLHRPAVDHKVWIDAIEVLQKVRGELDE